jgi:hypothetical protein
MARLDPTIDELLQPSLSGGGPSRAPYSPRVGMLTAFFGGPFAGAALQAVNAWRMQRLRADAPWLAAALAGVLAGDWWLRGSGQLLALARWLEWHPADLRNLLLRFGALAVFAVASALHAPAQRSVDLMGRPRPNGWLPGIVLIVAGNALLIGWTLITR